jgi:Ca-activated chloride channel homolog
MIRTIIRLVPLISFLALACADKQLPPPKLVPPLGSRVELAAGEVWLTVDSDRQRLISGAMLPQIAKISLEDGARALIRLGNGTGAFLRGGSEVAINDNFLDLKKGEMWIDVPIDERELGKFAAGAVIVSASGAGFDIAMEGEEVIVYVARGLAVVESPGGRAEVQSGEKARVAGSETAPEVKPVGFWEDWTGGMADRELQVGAGGKGTGRIYGIDRLRPGSPPSELHIQAQEVRTIIRDGIAHTTVDQRFFNPAGVDVEGWYWFTVPEGASVERFALEVNGILVEGEMVERGQAARAYEEAVQRAIDPALLEWVSGRTFRARIFPIPATGERRVVLSYTQFLPLSDGAYHYVYPMGGQGEQRIQEFSLQVMLGDEGKDYEIATLQDARVEEDSSMVSMRRSGFIPRSDFLLELRPTEKVDSLRAARFSTGRNEADYVMLRYSPEVDWDAVKNVPGDVVVVMDTSAGGGDTERQIRTDAVEAILRALSNTDRFAIVTTDLSPKVVFPDEGLATADDESVSRAMEKLSEISSAGATDLGEMFQVAFKLVHEAEQPAVVYVGDGRPTVGETSSYELAERLRRSLGDTRSRLFTIAVGADANHSLLQRLSRMGGGRSFRVDTPEQTVQEALRFSGMVKTPTITNLEIDAGAGLDQEFSTVSKKVSEGEEVVLLARSHHKLPEKITVKGRLQGKSFERAYKTDVKTGRDFGFVPSLWARMYLERLMGEGLSENRGTIISLGLGYALMTPFTSFLVLENDEAYMMQGIPRRPRHHSWIGFEGRQNHPGVSTKSNGVEVLSDREMEDDRVMEESADYNDEPGYHREKRASRAESAPSEVLMPQPVLAPPAAPKRSVSQGVPGGVSGGALGGAYGYGKSSSGDGGGMAKKAQESVTTYWDGDATGGLGGLAASEMGQGGGGSGYGRASGTTAGLRGNKGSRSKDRKQQQKKEKAETVESMLERAVRPGPAAQKSSRPLFTRGACSDASRRPLSQRRLLWRHSLSRAEGSQALAQVFWDAGSKCELPRWKERKELLAMIESHARTASDVYSLLAQFYSNPKILKFLRSRIIKRTLDPTLVTHLYEPTGIDWHLVRRGLAAVKTPEERLEKLREVLENSPEDPAGRALLIETLLDLDKVDEAIAVATRLRRDELAGPMVLQVLCDLQSEVGLQEEARRTCSELVEFNETDPNARERLGDLFLRHGWYGAAYRQYKTLVIMKEDDPAAWLRLAASAAGMGKVDEALRIERKVASGDGETGPMDPRRFARLHSAVRLAQMIISAKSDEEKDHLKALERSLKRTQNFTEASTFVMLVWEDYETPLQLVATRDKKPYTVSDRVESQGTGLVMLDLGREIPADVELTVKHLSAPPRRSVKFKLVTIAWDGQEFTVAQKAGVLAPRSKEIAVKDVK